MKNKKIKKETFMQSVLVLMVSQIIIKALGLIYKLYLTNREGFGDKGNAISGSGFQIYALFLTISSVGVPNAVAKLVSERVAVGDHRGAHRIFKIALITFGIIGFICSSILFFQAGNIANYFLQIPEAEMTLVALSPSLFFVTIAAVIKGYFSGRENLKVTANSQTIEQVFKMGLSIMLVEFLSIVSGASTTIMAAGASLSTTLATGICLGYLYRYYHAMKKEIAWEIKSSIHTKSTRIRKTIKNILSVSIPMSLSAILGTLNKNIDSMTVVRGLKKFLSEEQAKIQYGILNGKVDTLVTLPMSMNIAFATALVPAISSAKAKGDIHTVKKRISFSLLVTILIGLPCMVGMILFAEPILNLLFPNATAGVLVYQISCISIIFIVLEQTMGGSLHGLGKIIAPAIALSVGVIIKLFLNIVLIPIDSNSFVLGGINGAAFSTVICHMIAVTLEFIILKRQLPIQLPFSKFVIKPIIATTIMAISSFTIFNFVKEIAFEKLATIIAMLFAIIIYVFLLFILKIFTKEELFMIPFGQKVYKTREKVKRNQTRKS